MLLAQILPVVNFLKLQVKDTEITIEKQHIGTFRVTERFLDSNPDTETVDHLIRHFTSAKLLTLWLEYEIEAIEELSNAAH